MGNKPRVYIMGAVAVIVSGVKLEDWKRMERYAPDSLMIHDMDGDPVFRVEYGPGPGYITEHGIQWGSYTTEEGNATVTLIFGEDVDDKREAVESVAGPAFEYLAKIEQVILEGMDKEYVDSGARFIVI